jgi:hypothetical protein
MAAALMRLTRSPEDGLGYAYHRKGEYALAIDYEQLEIRLNGQRAAGGPLS